MKLLSILGATGSIGRNALEIIDMFPERFKVTALAARRNVALLAHQIQRFRPQLAVVFDAEAARELQNLLPADLRVEILHGDDGYQAAATHASVNLVLSAMVGAAGLMPTLAAIAAGKDVALANKETLVMAGETVTGWAAARKVRILPVDSEHSAIFQCLAGNRRHDLKKVILTASGGPFLNRSPAELKTVTPRQALAHPTWRMGSKVSIDSATLMNKGLEVIEAHWLFGVRPQDIEVVIHPQSVIHSMVAYQDGAVIAQLGVPDMKGAIAYALAYPERLDLKQAPPDFVALGALTFQQPDRAKFPCLDLAYQACTAGGTLPAVMNAANEIAVEAFLNGRLGFAAIPELIDRTMQQHSVTARPSLEEILAADRWARSAAHDALDG